MSTTTSYEILFILDAGLEDVALRESIGKVTGIIKEGGGEVVNVNQWGRREMAYEVERKRMGYYVLIDFRGSKPILDELDKNLKLDDNFLRHLVTRKLKQPASKEAGAEETPRAGVADTGRTAPGPASGGGSPVAEGEPEGEVKSEDEGESTTVKEVDGFGAIT